MDQDLLQTSLQGFFVILLLVQFLSLWRVFEKAGVEGWKSIIPFYNFYTLLKIVGKPGWWLWMMFVPGANIVYFVWTINMLSKSFGKNEGFTFGIIFFGFIFIPILAFSDAEYSGPLGNKKEYINYGLKGYKFGKARLAH
jgi:hypothetical protein